MRLNKQAIQDLKDHFGDYQHVNFEWEERVIYSHDMGSLPQVIDRMIDTVPQAVVRIRNEEDILYMVQFSKQYQIPLTPRGNATSGYGDSMPFGKGIVLDFMSMNQVLSVDRVNKTATVQPGIVFIHLEKYLENDHLALRVMPSSAPGATVGGWVAEGGSGIGSYRYGYFKQNIESIEAILMTGEKKVFSGNELDLIYATQGTIGLITKVTIRLRDALPIKPYLVHFPNMDQYEKFLIQLTKTENKIYNLQHFLGDSLNRRFQAIKSGRGVACTLYHNQENFLKLEWDQSFDQHGVYAAIAVEGEEEPQWKTILPDYTGKLESSVLAQFIWDERFYPMREKRLGPSLIPSEAIMPVQSLEAVYREARNLIPDVSLEGTLVNQEEVVLLGFVLHDERTFSFAVDYVKSLALMGIIEKHGGRLYQVGVFFTDKAESIKGKEIMEKLRVFKKKADPMQLLNPGKLFPSKLVPSLLKIAMKAGKSGSSMALMVSKLLQKHPFMNKRLAQDIVYEAFACAQCGYCKVVCSEYLGKGWESATPRGKFYYLREFARGQQTISPYLKDEFLLCTTCKRCNHVCQVNIPIQEKWDDMRGFLIHDKKMATFPAFEMMGGSYEQEMDIWTGRKSERDQWFPQDVQWNPGEPLNYWAGCTASFVETDIGINSVRILQEGKVPFQYLGKEESCCGIPFAMAGKWDLFEGIVRYNLKKFQEKGIRQIVTSCPGCWVALSHYYKEWSKKLGIPYDISVIHITQIAADLIKSGKITVQPKQETITYHDPCHIGRHGGIYEEPRTILKAINGDHFKEMEHNRDNGLCCGSVLTRISQPDVSDKIACARIEEAAKIGAEKIITNCPCCEFQLRVGAKSNNKTVEIVDIATYLTQALNCPEAPDPNELVHKMWGVFLGAINMMSPDGVVTMMKQLFPEMVNAMPPVFRGMTKFVMKLPKWMRKPMAWLFKKMLPGLMPVLLPGMLPKMAPDVQKLMEEGIPDMPDSMREMMPKILPSVLDKVMKGLLPLTDKRIAQDFEAFLMNAH